MALIQIPKSDSQMMHAGGSGWLSFQCPGEQVSRGCDDIQKDKGTGLEGAEASRKLIYKEVSSKLIKNEVTGQELGDSGSTELGVIWAQV